MCVMREGCSSSYLLAVRKTLFSIRAQFRECPASWLAKKVREIEAEAVLLLRTTAVHTETNTAGRAKTT